MDNSTESNMVSASHDAVQSIIYRGPVDDNTSSTIETRSDEDDNEVDIGSETSLVGYISIKDFAYEESNPLHYGYYEDDLDETEDATDVDGGYIGDESFESNTTANNSADSDRRQSILLSNDYIVNKRAVALYDFEPENDNELGFKKGDIVFISYRHGQGWLVAENQAKTKTGLVPEEFVSFIEPTEVELEEDNNTARPFYLTRLISKSVQTSQGSQSSGDEWEYIDNLETDLTDKLKIRDDDDV